jgi:hypothetical protein
MTSDLAVCHHEFVTRRSGDIQSVSSAWSTKLSEGQRLGQGLLQSRLQERDMPDVAPNELHKIPVFALA